MPILKREPDLYPESLFESSSTDAPWWVAYVRSRQEKSLARHLLQREIPFYLPNREKEIRRNGRRAISHLPLFSGYVFFCGRRGERVEALRSNLIVQLLEVQDQDLLHHELTDLYHLQQSGMPLILYPFLGPGDVVEVNEGPFKGYRGRVLREKGQLRLVVSISLLRRSVAVELDRELLTPIRVSRLAPRPATACAYQG